MLPNPIEDRQNESTAGREVASGDEPPVLEALQRQAGVPDQLLQFPGPEEPIGRQVAGVEPQCRREMPVPAVVAIGRETHEDAPHAKGSLYLAQGEWLIEDVLQRSD